MAKKLVVKQNINGIWVDIFESEFTENINQEEEEKAIKELLELYKKSEHAWTTEGNFGVLFWPEQGPIKISIE